MSMHAKSDAAKTDSRRSILSAFISPSLRSGSRTDRRNIKYDRSTLILDTLLLAAIVILVCWFYYPKTTPLKSTYVYYADSFERAGHIYNSEYQSEFKRYSWENYSPLQTLLARLSSTVFSDEPGHALLLMHMCVVLISATATYILNRQFLSVALSFLTTALLFCDRTLLPVTRGLGMTQAHLLIPLSLLFILTLPRIMNPSGAIIRKAVWIALSATCLAGVYLLGNHETFYGAFCLGLGVCIMVGWRTVRPVFSRHIPVTDSRSAFARLARFARELDFPRAQLRSFFTTFSRLRFLLITVSLALALAVGGMVAVQRGIPERLGRTPLWSLLTYEHLGSLSLTDAKKESSQDLAFKLQVLKGTFLEGRYLTPLGLNHENCFLPPGPGFNGIIPLFLLPGLVIGLVCYVRKTYSAARQRHDPVPGGDELYLLFLGVLLIFFAVMIVSGADPKPTRYTYAIYAIYVIGLWGYEHLAFLLKGRLDKYGSQNQRARWGRAASLTAACLVFIPLTALLTLRLQKNYRDLQTYLFEYSHQIPTIALGPILDKALALSSDSHIAILLPQNPRYGLHPSVGMYTRFRLPSNIHFVSSKDEWNSLPAGTDVIQPEVMPGPGYYGHPRWRWPELEESRQRRGRASPVESYGESE